MKSILLKKKGAGRGEERSCFEAHKSFHQERVAKLFSAARLRSPTAFVPPPNRPLFILPQAPTAWRVMKKKRDLLLLGGGLGDLAITVLLLDLLDDSDSDSLSHVTDGETSKRWVLLESLNAHRLGRNESDESSLSVLQELRVVLKLLSGTLVHLDLELRELAGNVGGMAIQDWAVSSADLSRVVHDDDLGDEGGGSLGWVVLGVGGDVSSLELLDGDVLDVESDVVSWNGLGEDLVVHLDRLDLSGQATWGEDDDHSWLDDSGLDSSDWNSSDSSDLVNVLEGKSEWLVGWSDWWGASVEGLQEGRSLVPVHVGGSLDHVVTLESGDRDEVDLGRVVSDLLQVSGNLLDNLLVSGLGVLWLGGVHLVEGDDHLLDSQGEGKESVLSGLSVLGDTGLESSVGGVNDEDGAIGLGGSGDHVLDEISVSWGVDDRAVVLWGLELPQGDIDGDTSLSLGLQLVQNPGVLERPLVHLSGLLLELLDDTLVDSSELVDQVSGSGGLTTIDVTDDDDVKMKLFLSHGFFFF
mmetsp:Transcript_16754/g.37905  ORF Transcript_16754/g.37905 Transcript_16754/m.37905 type:complete len:525 (-) Transcript_16754:84-1658(-)